MRILLMALALLLSALLGALLPQWTYAQPGPTEWGQTCWGRLEITSLPEPDMYYVTCLLPVNYPYRFPFEYGELPGISPAPPTSAATGVAPELYSVHSFNPARR